MICVGRKPSSRMRFVLLLSLAALASTCSGQNARRVGRLREVFSWRQITFNINGNQRKFDLSVSLTPASTCSSQNARRVGRLREVFSWRQITFNINRNQLLQDRAAEPSLDDGSSGSSRARRQAGVVFPDDQPGRDWDQTRPGREQQFFGTNRPTTTTTARPTNDDEGRFFIQYNNLPMGVERVGNRLFVTLPRRRFGIPSTLNYIDLVRDGSTRSPDLRPYPDMRRARNLTSVYRTRADRCGRLWMVDTGLLEIPDNRRQVQRPAIVVFDLNTDEQLFRYELKDTDVIAESTPTGLASITVDFVDPNDCTNVYAYVPDLTTYGLIVYSLRDNDSWRLSHNYFSFNPLAGNLRIADQSFQWSDGIFSLTLREAPGERCPTAYFHAMVGTTEFSVSACVLRNRTASQDSQFWQQFAVVGDRGTNSQSTMHGYHAGSGVMFFADIARDAVSCWRVGSALTPANVGIVAQDKQRLSYPSDLHVTDDEVWVMANSLPRWGYSRLDTNQYNFYIYSGNVRELIANTVCGPRIYSRMGTSGESSEADPVGEVNATATAEQTD